MSKIRNLSTNLSVGAKLWVGFGLVLFLTASVAVTAFISITTLQQHSERLRGDLQVQAQVLQARIAEKDFALVLDERAAQQVRQTVEQLQAALSVDANSTRQEMASAAQAYVLQFEQYVKSLHQLHDARVGMQRMARVAAESFNAVFLDQLDGLSAGADGQARLATDQFALLEQSAALRDKLAQMRDSELSYSVDNDQSRRADWEMGMSDVLSTIDTLSLRVGDDGQASLKSAREALKDYRLAFAQFATNRDLIAQSKASMQHQSEYLGVLLAALEQEQARAIAQSGSSANRQLGIITLLALSLGIGSSLLIRQTILRPLREAVAWARRIADGDLSGPRQSTVRKDELGLLLHSFGDMLDSLRGLVRRISQGVEQLNGTTGNLATVISNTYSGVEQQRKETEVAVTSMQQMSSRAREVARNTYEANDAVMKANEQARDGNLLVQRAADRAGFLTQEMNGCAEVMHELLGECSAISGVLDVIKSVAVQTNLLALNASIEAARAGEHGRGFAVVADEVRGLAQRTQASTDEIKSLIDRLCSAAQQAATRLQENRLLTDESAVLAGEASVALERITQAVATIEQMNQQIATATEQQSIVAEEVNLSMTKVRVVAEECSQQNLSLQASNADLQKVSGALNVAVRHFQI
ncbi:HAMP domain-containing protein [Pseudomonas putida]|uniref:HAMP domain-containing protein n=2 Tax=Pseudomonas putida TaxID=303 RepID=A0A2Z4RDW1_PSEPU|nr:methyl-accepting chemotaxis protein [Pseudomonas putida]AWY39019.1 HAMP domain-containing protein [Pseudomonas putida]